MTQDIATVSPTKVVERYRDDFAVALPSHIAGDGWLRGAMAAIRRDPKLSQAVVEDAPVMLGALLQAARLGLNPGTDEYWLIPQTRKLPNGRRVQSVSGQAGYQGLIELIYRAGAAESVICEVVREHDTFRYRPGQGIPDHDIDWMSPDRGELRLVYAYARMRGGAISKVIVLNQVDIDRAKQSAQGADRSDSPWKQHEEAMWLKTAIRRLSKWVPTSPEYLTLPRGGYTAALPPATAVDAPPSITGGPAPIDVTALEEDADTTGAEPDDVPEPDGQWATVIDDTPEEPW